MWQSLIPYNATMFHATLAFVLNIPSLLCWSGKIADQAIFNSHILPFYPHTVIAGYEKSIQHTYIPMSILAVTYSIVIISIPLLYKWMAPQAIKTKPLRLGAFYSLTSLNEFNTEQGATLYACNTYIDYRLN